MAYSALNYFNVALPRSAQATSQFWETTGTAPVYGTDGPDVIGGGGALGHVLTGGKGDDTYHVFAPLDRVIERPGEGVDTVIAAYTDFTLPDAVENLTIKGDYFAIGNAGANIIEGDGGAQHIIGRGGDDVLVGGGGADVFVFAPHSGYDVIADFDGASGDRLRLDGYGFTTFDQLKAAMTQVGADVVLRTSDGSAILLRDQALSDLRVEHFQIGFDPAHLRLTFEETFDSLSLYQPDTGQGIWRTNFWYGPSAGLGI